MDQENSSTERPSRSETMNALVHYYRAEVTRSLAWRERLDRTTNWAVGAAAAFLGFAFSHEEIHHSVFLFSLAIVYTLLFVETRRFRYFDAYEYRVRMLHQNFIHGILVGNLPLEANSYWMSELAEDLRYPQYKIDFLHALGRRIRSSYIFLFGILLAGWLLKIDLHPHPAHSPRQYLDQASMAGLPGWITLLFIFLFICHAGFLVYIGSRQAGGRDLFHPDRLHEDDL
ncbi:MAG: DUF2270 domain-containing protein [Geobacteraceae bacterium]